MMRLQSSLLFLLLTCAVLCSSAGAQMAAKRAASGISGRYKVNHPISLGVEHGTLTISRERIKFEASNGRGFDHARSDLSVAREWTGMLGGSYFMAEFKFNDGTIWHFTNESAQIRAAGLFTPRMTNFQALINAANSPDSTLVPLEAIANARTGAQRTGEPDKDAMMDPAMALYLASAQQSRQLQQHGVGERHREKSQPRARRLRLHRRPHPALALVFQKGRGAHVSQEDFHSRRLRRHRKVAQ